MFHNGNVKLLRVNNLKMKKIFNMEKGREKFLDQIVENLIFPISKDFYFFGITDIYEKKYILRKYFKKIRHMDFRIIIDSRIRVMVSYFTQEHYSYCTLYNECLYSNNYSLYEYDEYGNNTLYIVNGEEQPLIT